MSSVQGIYDSMQLGFDAITEQSNLIKSKMQTISTTSSSEDKQTVLLELQFMMGNYTAMVELTSSISKSITDTIKSITQKVG